MKKIIFFLLLIFVPFILNAQMTFDLSGVAQKKISSNISQGSDVKILKIDRDSYGNSATVTVKVNDNLDMIPLNQLSKIEFKPTTAKEFWQSQIISKSTYENFVKNGMQYKLRKDLEEDALEYHRYMEYNNLIFQDSFLESYLYALIYRIYPCRIDDGRPGILNVKIYKDISPNAFIFPNGSMFVSTGLLSTINSEEELIGLLAHEISHFVLDHAIVNINVTEQRQKRAEFWAAFATGLAAAADVYTASRNEYYSPGAITMSGALLAYSVAESVNNRMGIKYSQKQELEADACAVELMKFIGVNPTALSSVLMKIKSYCIVNGDYLALTGEGSHPAIDDRINLIGKPTQFASAKYDKIISFVNSFNAILEFNSQHFIASTRLIERNVLANVATEEDLVLLAMSTLNLYDTDAKNVDALALLEKAKNLKVAPTVNLYKYEAIAFIRLRKLQNAQNSLNSYKEKLCEEQQALSRVINSKEWSLLNNYIIAELDWTAKMINKTRSM